MQKKIKKKKKKRINIHIKINVSLVWYLSNDKILWNMVNLSKNTKLKD